MAVSARRARAMYEFFRRNGIGDATGGILRQETMKVERGAPSIFNRNPPPPAAAPKPAAAPAPARPAGVLHTGKPAVGLRQVVDPATQELVSPDRKALEEFLRRRAIDGGRRSTVLTGLYGLPEPKVAARGLQPFATRLGGSSTLGSFRR